MKSLFAAVLVIAVLVAATNAYIGLTSLHRVDHLIVRVSNDEHQTCVIQARGLPAGHELAASMNDIHSLLTLPPQPNAPPVPPHVLAIVSDLNDHLSAYQLLENAQPPTRLCK